MFYRKRKRKSLTEQKPLGACFQGKFLRLFLRRNRFLLYNIIRAQLNAYVLLKRATMAHMGGKEDEKITTVEYFTRFMSVVFACGLRRRKQTRM